jgi:hypothetical protein
MSSQVCSTNKRIKPKENVNHIKPIKLDYNIDIKIIDTIIRNLLLDCCNITVFGYDNYNYKYWCKKFNNNICELYLELEINCKKDDELEIILTPLVCSEKDINFVKQKLNECIILYKTSDLHKYNHDYEFL